jgi:glycosyltransferase involved in cell wall biosynthesis
MVTRVLYVLASATPGGAERATMSMIAAHDRVRYLPAVLFFEDGPLVEDVRKLGVDATVLGARVRLRNPRSLLTAVLETRRVIATSCAALVHACMSYSQLISGAAASLANVPSVLYQHGPLGSWMDGAATLLRCDHVVTNSRHTAAGHAGRAWRRRAITVIPPAVEMTMPTMAGREALRASVNVAHGLPPDVPVIGMTARLDPWKGIDVALRALAPLLRERRELRFVVVGGQYRAFHADYASQLRTLVEQEGIAQQVIFAGFRDDVRPYLARMTALVHASIQPEPFGLTLVEAMAFGVPVVCAHAGGAAEIVEPGINGLAYPPGHESELRAAVTSLLDSEPLRRRLIEAGLRTVDDRYRPPQMIQMLERVYDEVLSNPLAGTRAACTPARMS